MIPLGNIICNKKIKRWSYKCLLERVLAQGTADRFFAWQWK